MSGVSWKSSGARILKKITFLKCGNLLIYEMEGEVPEIIIQKILFHSAGKKPERPFGVFETIEFRAFSIQERQCIMVFVSLITRNLEGKL